MIPEEIATLTLQERLALARSPDSADELLILLTQDRRVGVRRALTERKDLSEQLMQQLVNDKSKDIRLRMAKHPELKIEFQEILSESMERSIRAALARREDLPEELLLKLAASYGRNVGLALVKRKMLSDELLEQLINHGSKDVRIALARRKTLPDALITALVEDKIVGVVTAISRRKKLSVEHILKLSSHRDKYVRAAIAARDDLPKEIIEKLVMDTNIEVLSVVANRDNLPGDLLDKMLSQSNNTLRTELARKEPLRQDVVDALALDKDDQVRAAIAYRSDITRAMIDRFATDDSTDVRLAVAWRSDLSEQLSQQLLRQLPIDDLCLGKMSDLLKYIKKESNAHLTLTIEGRKLVFENGDSDPGSIEYGRLRQLLPIVFLHPASRKIQQLEIQIDRYGYYDEKLNALSVLKAQVEVKRISFVTEYGGLNPYDLSMSFCENLDVISKQNFPNLEYLSVEGTLNRFKLNFPKLKEIFIASSGNDFHELMLMLMKCNLPNLETIFISAGYDVSFNRDHQDNPMKFYLEHAHNIWPYMKSLTIGARFAYDWHLLLSSPLFRQLDELVINIDDPFIGTDDAKTMWSSVTNLIDALINQSDYLSNIGAVTVGIGDDFECEGYNLRIDGKKLSHLKKLYNFKIEYSAYVGGHE